jgi:uncharacterized membrane-anchored protein
MSFAKTLPAAALGFALLAQPAGAQIEKPDQKLNVIHGPAEARLEGVARIQVPSGYAFVDAAGTRMLMKASGEPVSGDEVGMISPTNEDWTVMFEFDKTGYVKDDEKDKLDADKMLAAIKRGTAYANKERQRNGMPPLEVVGWEQPPRYNSETHNLEWAVRATCQGRPLLNYNTRLLGRKGVMEVVLIVDPDDLPASLPKFRNLLASYSFQPGQTYAEYKPGDKVAAYGLTALVVGGAAVGAAKLGLFAWLAVLLKKGWKLIVVVFVAIITFFKRLFARLTGRGTSSSTST